MATRGYIPSDDSDIPVIGVWSDVLNKALPAYVGSTVTGADGQTYAVLQTTGGGGGTQYTDAGTPPAHPIGSALVFDNSGTWADVGIDAGLPVNIVAGSSAGTQYTDAGTPPAHPIGTAIIWDNAGSWVDAGSDQPLPVVSLHGSAVDANNSSTSLLNATIVFTGTSTNSLNYSAIAIDVQTDQNSASNGLSVQQSQDNSHWDIVDTFTVTGGTNFQTTVNLVANYYRIVYTNGGTNQGTFRLQTIKQTSEVVLPRTLTAAGNLRVDGSSVTQPVSGTFWQATQPVSGTVTANAGTGNFTVVQATGTNLHTVIDAGSAVIGHVINDAGAAVIGSVMIQAVSGTALVADQSNSELRVSLYGKQTVAGDTALVTDSNSALKVAQQVGGAAITDTNAMWTEDYLRGLISDGKVFTSNYRTAATATTVGIALDVPTNNTKNVLVFRARGTSSVAGGEIQINARNSAYALGATNQTTSNRNFPSAATSTVTVSTSVNATTAGTVVDDQTMGTQQIYDLLSLSDAILIPASSASAYGIALYLKPAASATNNIALTWAEF